MRMLRSTLSAIEPIAVIWSIQLVFALKAAIGNAVTFRMYGKQRLVQLELDYFRRNRFPRAELNERNVSMTLRHPGTLI